MTNAAVGDLLGRIDRVEERLRRLSEVAAPPGLADPDPGEEERWNWGQVWAHTAEFPAYWVRQIRAALASPGDGPPSFGRVKSDPGRVGAIERDRSVPPTVLMGRLEADLQDLRGLIAGLSDSDWAFEVRHQSLGVMALPRAIEEFLVGHLEAHADQLDRLSGSASNDP